MATACTKIVLHERAIATPTSSHGHVNGYAFFEPAHGRLAWHHFFPEWLAALRFISGKKDPTLPALRPSS